MNSRLRKQYRQYAPQTSLHSSSTVSAYLCWAPRAMVTASSFDASSLPYSSSSSALGTTSWRIGSSGSFQSIRPA